MKTAKFLKNHRVSDPYIDRRSGDNRRQAYDADYFEIDGRERRKGTDRRQIKERRGNYVRVSKWASVCADY